MVDGRLYWEIFAEQEVSGLSRRWTGARSTTAVERPLVDLLAQVQELLLALQGREVCQMLWQQLYRRLKTKPARAMMKRKMTMTGKEFEHIGEEEEISTLSSIMILGVA